MQQNYDVIVLGGGSAGESVAPEVASTGRSVAVVESALVGGECPFYACMPSKAMLRSAEIRHSLTRVRELGAMGDDLHLRDPGRGYARATTRRDEITDHRTDDRHVASLEESGVDVHRGEGRVSAPGRLDVTVDGQTVTLSWTDLVLATGAEPTAPPIDGLDTTPYWTSADAWSTSERPSSLAVIGGGPVGCEIAQAFARFGVAVTLVEAGPRLIGSVEPEVADWLAEQLSAEGIEVLLDAPPNRVDAAGEGVRLSFDDHGTVTAERLVVATGVTPRLARLGLEQLGLDPDDGLDLDDRCLVHNADAGAGRRVFAAGDVTGVAPFTHVANYQGRIVAANLTGGDARADYRAVPRAVYTAPTVAAVGMTADEARDAGHDVRTATFDLADTSRVAVDAGPGGRVVVVADARDRILLGASAVGPQAMDWLGEVRLAVAARVPLDVLADQIHAFPTYGEGLGICYRELAG